MSRASFAPGGATPENVAVARALRAEFPAFGPGGLADPAGRQFSYLDNAATSSPKPECVVKAVLRALTEINANPGRAGHMRSLEAARWKPFGPRAASGRHPATLAPTTHTTDRTRGREGGETEGGP